MIVYAQGDITKFDVDAIVNASNGFGYMGGKRCVNELHRGVAESIQFASCGAVERLARAKCKAHSFFGYSPGTVFVTDAPNLECKKIIHAVTMRTPGSKAKIKKIKDVYTLSEKAQYFYKTKFNKRINFQIIPYKNILIEVTNFSAIKDMNLGIDILFEEYNLGNKENDKRPTKRKF